MIVINPRCASAARVNSTWSGMFVCLLSHISPTERLFVLDLPENTAFKSYAANQYFDLPAVSFFQQSARGYPTIVYNIRPCPKRCLLMPLPRVVERTESTTLQLHARRGQFPRTHWHSTKQYAVRAEGFALFTRT